MGGDTYFYLPLENRHKDSFMSPQGGCAGTTAYRPPRTMALMLAQPVHAQSSMYLVSEPAVRICLISGVLLNILT